MVRPIYFHTRPDKDEFAFSVNASKCGICIITNRSLSLGESVKLYSRFFWDEPKAAMVVWTQEVNYHITKFGLSICPALAD